jgi:hypothetical protein
MNTGNTFQMIVEQQETWATGKTFTFEKSGKGSGYAHFLADNLLYPTISVKTLDDYMAGQGSELERHMRALYSSSALVVNFFEYWRQTQRISEVARLCGASVDSTDMEFEKKYKIANLGTPNLDIVFSGKQAKPFAIEAKFSEPYRTTTQRNDTNLDKYLNKESLWEGLQGCKKIAREILAQEGGKTKWEHLDVPQLIKHILGLSYKYEPSGFTLLYLWFDCGTAEAKELSREILTFRDCVKSEIDFRSMNYQELFSKIKGLSNVDKEYTSYLGGRYFPERQYALRPGTTRCDEIVAAEEKYGVLAGNVAKLPPRKP